MNSNSYKTYLKNMRTPVQYTIPHKCIMSVQAHIKLEVSITATVKTQAQ
jgi:hypothetical protein